MITMMVAAAVGDALAFRSGRRYGPALRAGPLGARVGDRRWARAEGMVNRLGGRGLLAARWLAFVWTVVPRLVGAAAMPYRRFAPWNLAGVATWVGTTVLVGYLAGESFRRVSRLLGNATGAVLAVLACVLVLVLAGRWLGTAAWRWSTVPSPTGSPPGGRPVWWTQPWPCSPCCVDLC